MASKRPPLDELLALFQAAIAAQGITTGAGAATGDSFIDLALAGAGADSFLGMTAILYPGEVNSVDSAIITGFNNATGEISLAAAYKGVAVAIPVGVAYKILTLKAISAEALTLLTNIFNLVNAMLVLTETGSTVTTTGPGTEDNVYVNDDPSGVFEPVKVQIDFFEQTAAETVVIRTYYRIKSGGTPRLKSEVTFAGVVSPPLKNIELEPNRFGIVVTIERTAGIAKDYDWCVFYRV
jgi:hypothetical protein